MEISCESAALNTCPQRRVSRDPNALKTTDAACMHSTVYNYIVYNIFELLEA